MIKVVYLVPAPFSRRDYDRCGVQLLLDQGIQVEIWNCAPFISKGQASSTLPGQIDFPGLQLLRSAKELVNAIRQCGDTTVFLSFAGFGYQYRTLYQSISRSRFVYGVPRLGALPPAAGPRLFVTMLRRAVQMPGKIPTALLNRSPLKSLGIRPLDFVLAGGTESVAGIYPTGPNTHIVWSHALDYEDFLKEQQVKRDKPTREYAVFLDQFMPFHPDYQLLGLPVPVKPNDYYRKLVEFFACLEDALGCQVVIAAHPRSNYESLPDYFNGRTMVKGQTVQLVRNAKIVLAHHSTSVNFANLYHKPVLFLNHDLDAGLESIAVENLAAEFGKKPINLNEPLSINWEKELVVDEAAYARYCGRYIKKVGSPEKPCWQIFADYVRTLAPA